MQRGPFWRVRALKGLELGALQRLKEPPNRAQMLRELPEIWGIIHRSMHSLSRLFTEHICSCTSSKQGQAWPSGRPVLWVADLRWLMPLAWGQEL